ncbi:unnamed protein product [Brassica oleracea]
MGTSVVGTATLPSKTSLGRSHGRHNKHWCKCLTLPPRRYKLDFEVPCSQKKSHLGLQSLLTSARGCMMRC